MKKLSFAVTVILMPLSMVLFSYLFLQVLEMRPVGVAISYVLRDLTALVILAVFYFCYFDQQIWVAIERFDETKRVAKSKNPNHIEIQAKSKISTDNLDRGE